VLAADISRWENAPTLREIIRLTYTLVGAKAKHRDAYGF
jgi:hypothetical protein